jgi:hypothetical protein
VTARLPTTTADVVPAYGMREAGGFGLRGWRVHCPHCGYLSRVYEHRRTISEVQRAHRCLD